MPYDKQTNDRITEKEKRFFEEYLKTYNMSDAYRKSHNGNHKNPARQAMKLMARPRCIAYLEKRKKEIQKKTDYSREKWFKELEGIAHANIFDYIDLETGELRDDVPRELFSAVKNIKINTHEYQTKDGRTHEKKTINVELHDKLKSIEIIGKHMSFISDKTTIDKSGDLNIFLGTAETLRLMQPKENTIDVDHEETD